MNRGLTTSSIILLASCLVACNVHSVSSSIDDTKPSSDESTIPSGDVLPSDDDALYELIYNPTADIKIDLFFTNEAIYKLAKYSVDEVKKEMYHPCSMNITINGEQYSFLEVGARMKGNTSRNENFVNADGTFNALVHFKLSLKETFDDVKDNDYFIRTWDDETSRDARKDREFAMQQKFDLKWNKSFDETYTKQIYAYDAFIEEGLLASHVNLVHLTIHSESDSIEAIYQLQETIDKDFLKQRLAKDEAQGNLYKSTYTDMGPASLDITTINSIGVEAANYHPSYDLKTNDKDDEIDHTLLTNIIRILNENTSNAATFKSVIDELIDVDAILKYQALCWVMGNPDDSRNNSNNYYIYFNSLTNKMVFIPYDFDRCLGILQDWPIHMENVPYYTTKQNLGDNRPWQPNPLLWRLIIEENDSSVNYSDRWPVITEYRDKYVEYCVQYAEKYLDNDRFIEFSNRFVYANKNYSSGGGANITFEEYATKKLATLN